MPRAYKQPSTSAAFETMKKEWSRLERANDYIHKKVEAGYSGQRPGKFRRRRDDIMPFGTHADWHIRYQVLYFAMNEYIRDMERNDLLIAHLLDMSANNTIQDGIGVDPSTSNKEANKRLLDKWYHWSHDPERCDKSGERTFAEQQWIQFRQSQLDGDVFAILPTFDDQIELLENHRCRTGNSKQDGVVAGIELDTNRKRMAFWFSTEDVNAANASIQTSKMRRVACRDGKGNRNVLQIYHPKRISLTRGMSIITPLLDTCGLLEDIQFAALVQQQIAACIAFIRKRGKDYKLGDAVALGPQSNEILDNGITRVLQQMTPGMIIEGANDETITGFSPNVPNPQYLPHINQVLKMLCAAAGIPLCMVMLDGSETNFSGWRGAVDTARMGFRTNQRMMAERFVTPSYRWKLRQWSDPDSALFDDKIAKILAKLGPDDFFRHELHLPSWRYIEPLKDANADAIRIKENLSSRRRISDERGEDFDQIRHEIAEDNGDLILEFLKKAEQINTQYPDANVTWRDVANISTGPSSSGAEKPEEQDDDEPGDSSSKTKTPRKGNDRGKD